MELVSSNAKTKQIDKEKQQLQGQVRNTEEQVNFQFVYG